MIAVQGPNARAKTAPLLPAGARACGCSGSRRSVAAEFGSWFVARTGYTGEDGFEIMLPAGRPPPRGPRCALRARGPRDSVRATRLRLEAGLSLYGNDLDEDHDPLSSGIAWTVAFEPAARQFIGRAALEASRAAPQFELVGLVLEDRGVLRSHQRVTGSAVRRRRDHERQLFADAEPLDRARARARRRARVEVAVDIRGKPLAARVVKPPFVRHGKIPNIHVNQTGE